MLTLYFLKYISVWVKYNLLTSQVKLQIYIYIVKSPRTRSYHLQRKFEQAHEKFGISSDVQSERSDMHSKIPTINMSKYPSQISHLITSPSKKGYFWYFFTLMMTDKNNLLLLRNLDSKELQISTLCWKNIKTVFMMSSLLQF